MRERLENEKESQLLSLKSNFQETISNLEKQAVEKDNSLNQYREKSFSLEEELSKMRAHASGLEISLIQNIDQITLDKDRIRQLVSYF